jgi:hypothetical protein
MQRCVSSSCSRVERRGDTIATCWRLTSPGSPVILEVLDALSAGPRCLGGPGTERVLRLRLCLDTLKRTVVDPCVESLLCWQFR